MRKRIFEIIEVSKESDQESQAYDLLMLIAIFISIVPLAFKRPPAWCQVTDVLTTCLFILDYICRYCTADLKLKRGANSFLLYPFTPWAIVDLISILPTLTSLSMGFKLFRLFRFARILRVLRVAKAMRYSKSFRMIGSVIRDSKNALMAVVILSIGYILVSALIIFNVEPNSFDSFFEAVYWATVSLTTVGYGDVYPVTTIGRFVAMVSSFFGIAVVALPAGIITAGYMNELEKEQKKEEDIGEE